jgi:hypothetical protein
VCVIMNIQISIHDTTDMVRNFMVYYEASGSLYSTVIPRLISSLPINIDEPGYNDIGVSDTCSVVPVNSSLLTVTLYSSVRTTLVYNDTIYSVPFVTL